MKNSTYKVWFYLYCASILTLIQIHTALPFLQNPDDIPKNITEYSAYNQPLHPTLLESSNDGNEASKIYNISPTANSPSAEASEPSSFDQNLELERSAKDAFPSIGDGSSMRRMDVIETSQDHSLPLDRFNLDPLQSPYQRWVAYFLQETIAVVLVHTESHTLKDCSLIEVRQPKLQRAALHTLGRIMELMPVSLEEMVPLITLCGMMHPVKLQSNYSLPLRDSRTTAHSDPHGATSSPFLGGMFGSLVLPGTLWCGMKDRADSYERLGEQVEADRCCRAHDHCPIKVSMFETSYGFSNFGLGTRSHCRCEFEFYKCLKNARSETAKLIGDVYFNVLGLDCLQDDDEETASTIAQTQGNVKRNVKEKSLLDDRQSQPPYLCVKFDRENRCRMWRKRKDIPIKVKKKKFRLKF